MLLDPQASESPLGQAVAANAIVAALLDELVSAHVLSLAQTTQVVKTALALTSGYSDSPVHDSARVTLMKMLKDRGAV